MTAPRCVILWRDDDVPVDRFMRDAAGCRAAARDVEAIIAELNGLVDRCELLEMGRESGARFWARWDKQFAVLGRVLERDTAWARDLDEADRLNRERNAR